MNNETKKASNKYVVISLVIILIALIMIASGTVLYINSMNTYNDNDNNVVDKENPEENDAEENNECQYNTDNASDNAELRELCKKENSQRILITSDENIGVELLKLTDESNLEKFNTELVTLYIMGGIETFNSVSEKPLTALNITTYYLTNFLDSSPFNCYNKEYFHTKEKELFNVEITSIESGNEDLEVLTNYYCPTVAIGGASIRQQFVNKISQDNKISYIYKIEYEFTPENNKTLSFNYEYASGRYILNSISEVQ